MDVSIPQSLGPLLQTYTPIPLQYRPYAEIPGVPVWLQLKLRAGVVWRGRGIYKTLAQDTLGMVQVVLHMDPLKSLLVIPEGGVLNPILLSK